MNARRCGYFIQKEPDQMLQNEFTKWVCKYMETEFDPKQIVFTVDGTWGSQQFPGIFKYNQQKFKIHYNASFVKKDVLTLMLQFILVKGGYFVDGIHEYILLDVEHCRQIICNNICKRLTKYFKKQVDLQRSIIFCKNDKIIFHQFFHAYNSLIGFNPQHIDILCKYGKKSFDNIVLVSDQNKQFIKHYQQNMLKRLTYLCSKSSKIKYNSFMNLRQQFI